jgi:hypothetical protein
MDGVRLLPLPQHLIHLSSQFVAPKPNLPILGSYNIITTRADAVFAQINTELLKAWERAHRTSRCRPRLQRTSGSEGAASADIRTIRSMPLRATGPPGSRSLRVQSASRPETHQRGPAGGQDRRGPATVELVCVSNGQLRKPSRSRPINQSAKVEGLALVAM